MPFCTILSLFCADNSEIMQISHNTAVITAQYLSNGLYEPQSQESIISKISEEILKLARDNDIADEFNSIRCPATVKAILVYLKTIAQVSDNFFDKIGSWIHCRNGVVEINDAGQCELKPFSPEYRNRNQCNLLYVPEANCPRFKDQLFAPLLETEDISLLQKYFGQCLLGRNITQTIMLLTGSGGSGKGTLANILELIVGTANLSQDMFFVRKNVRQLTFSFEKMMFHAIFKM